VKGSGGLDVAASKAESVFVALLRAVNVGGTGKLSMRELAELCQDTGFRNVKTYIQSGNVVFTSKLTAPDVKRKLEAALKKKMGKPVGVHVRTPAEIESVIKRNPFKRAAPNRLLVLFLDRAAPRNAFADLVIPGREEVELSGREVFIHYPDGMGRSKLRIPFADTATGRNLNTVTGLLELSRAISASS
jgi:uncharacterized protein (DUF1697 family)